MKQQVLSLADIFRKQNIRVVIAPTAAEVGSMVAAFLDDEMAALQSVSLCIMSFASRDLKHTYTTCTRMRRHEMLMHVAPDLRELCTHISAQK